MNVFDVTSAEEQAMGTKVYHDAVLLDMHDEEVAASKNMPDKSNITWNMRIVCY